MPACLVVLADDDDTFRVTLTLTLTAASSGTHAHAGGKGRPLGVCGGLSSALGVVRCGRSAGCVLCVLWAISAAGLTPSISR